MAKPKTSIIVPVWNTAKYLPKCLDSLTSQTLRDIEIICVNDGSTDGSGDILNEYAKRDKRIIVINQKNAGQSVARNKGLTKATAPYIMFCDSDDYYDPAMCEKMFYTITNNNVDLAMCGIKVVYMTHHNMKHSDDYYYGLKYSGWQEVSDDLVLATDGAPTNKIFKKELLDKYDIKFPIGLRYEDAYFYFAYLAVSDNIYFVFQKLYNYVRRAGSTMSNTWDKNATDHSADHVRIIIEFHRFLKKHRLLSQKQELFWRIFCLYYDSAYRHAKSRQSKLVTRGLVREFLLDKRRDLDEIDPRIRSQIISITSPLHSAKLKIKQIIGRIYHKISLGYRWQSSVINSANYIIGQNQNLQTRLSAIEQQLDEK